MWNDFKRGKSCFFSEQVLFGCPETSAKVCIRMPEINRSACIVPIKAAFLVAFVAFVAFVIASSFIAVSEKAGSLPIKLATLVL